VRNLHLEMLKEFEEQRHALRAAVAEEQREAASLRAENERLRDENRQLRGPLEGLAIKADLL
jgi:cell division protein FtsB